MTLREQIEAASAKATQGRLTGNSIRNARALHENAQLRAEIAALRPRETLEDVARREVDKHDDVSPTCFIRGFLRAAEMAKAGELPDA